MLRLKTVILYSITATLLAKSQSASNNGIASISNPIYLNTQRYELYINNDTKNYINTEWEATYDANKIIACTVHQPLLCIYAEPPQQTQQQQPSTLLFIHDEILNDFHQDDHWDTIKYQVPMDTTMQRRRLFIGRTLRRLKRKARRAMKFGRRAVRRAASIARRARSAVKKVTGGSFLSRLRRIGRARRRRPRRRRTRSRPRRRRRRSRPRIRGPRGARGPRGRRGRSGVPVIRGFIRTVKRKLRKLRRRNKRRLCQMQGPCSGMGGMGMGGMGGMGGMPMMPPMAMVPHPIAISPHPMPPVPAMMNQNGMGVPMSNPMMPPKIEIKTEVHKHSRRLLEDMESEPLEGFVAEKCVLTEEVEICLWYDVEDGKVLVDYTQIEHKGLDGGNMMDEVDYVEKFEWMVAKKMVIDEQIDECQDGVLPEEIGFDAVCVRKWSGDESEVGLMVKDGVKEMEFSLIDDKDWNEIYFVNADGQKLCRMVFGNRLCVEFSIDIEFNAIKEIKSISIEHTL